MTQRIDQNLSSGGWAALVPLVAAVGVVGVLACSWNGSTFDAGAEDVGAEFESDTRPDVDADSDDGRPDVVPEADGDADGDEGEGDDADADADPDEARDTEGDAEADADALLPRGCRFVRPFARFMWAGRDSMQDGAFVWMWLDESSLPSVDVVAEWDLALGSSRELIRRTFPDSGEYPAVHGDSLVFTSHTVDHDADSREVFVLPRTGGSLTQVTHNTMADTSPISGDSFVVYESSYRDPEGILVAEFRYADLSDFSEHVIVENTALSEVAFDGHHWVAMENAYQLHRFDLLDPGAGVQPLTMGPPLYSHGLSFDRDTGTLVASTSITGVTDDYRLELWDVASGTMTVLLDEPWSQVLPDVDGHVVVYQDSQAAGESYGEHQRSDLRIVDRDSGVKRVVMPLDTYYGVAIWERWIAFNNYGMYGDSLITCDLVEAGYLDADLHVIPE